MSNLTEDVEKALLSEYDKIEAETQTVLNLQQFVKKINFLLLFLLAALLIGPIIMILWLSPDIPRVSFVSIDNIQTVGSTQLCPGDTLVYSFDFSSRGSGIIEVDETTFRITPPATIIYSDVQRFVLRRDFSRKVYRSWSIPPSYDNEQDGSQSLFAAGEYERIIAVSSPHFDSLFTTGVVPFTIRQDCYGD